MRKAFAFLLGFCGLVPSACTPESAPPAPTFAELQPRFFAALQLQNAAARHELPAFEAQMDRMAGALLDATARDELVTEADQEAAGRALFYASFLLQAGQQAVQDGLMSPAELFAPRRYAPPEADDTAEYLARLDHARVMLDRADRLRPRDNLSDSVLANLGYQSEILRDGRPGQVSVDTLLDASNRGFAGMFNALIMWRDPEQHPLTAPHMEQLLDTVCNQFRFACDKMGPLPMPPGAPRTLTMGVSGPVLASDLLVRRAEALLQRADDSPAARSESLGEAMQRLGTADRLLGTAQTNSQAQDLAHYPFAAALGPRRQRLTTVLAAAMSRVAGDPKPTALPSRDYYRSSEYRLAYQCVGCHTRGPRSEGVPQ